MSEIAVAPAAVETTESAAPTPAQSIWDGVLTPRVLLAASLLLSVLVMVSGLALYHRLVIVPRQQVATVSLRDLLELKQLQVTIALTKPGVTDREREAGYDEIANFAKELETALGDLATECGCTILVRDAVVKTRGDDLTPQLAKRLGVSGLKRDELIERLRRQGGSSAPFINPEGGALK